jgi:uncharacterized protein (UPF0216 family)
MHSGETADRILERIHAHVRKQLPECKRRTIAELTVLFSGLHIEIADILTEDCATEDD